jgi:hypothetical protein
MEMKWNMNFVAACGYSSEVEDFNYLTNLELQLPAERPVRQQPLEQLQRPWPG